MHNLDTYLISVNGVAIEKYKQFSSISIAIKSQSDQYSDHSKLFINNHLNPMKNEIKFIQKEK